VTRTDRIVRMGVRSARRIVIGVVGLTAVLVGIALLVLPGPAFLVIPIGLGILAIEFEWARRLLRRARRLYEERLVKPPSR
jgi:tellurite resistance protein TerC